MRDTLTLWHFPQAAICSPRRAHDQTIRVWETATNTCKEIFAGHAGRVQSSAPPRLTGEFRASASRHGTITGNDQPIADGANFIFAVLVSATRGASSTFRHPAPAHTQQLRRRTAHTNGCTLATSS